MNFADRTRGPAAHGPQHGAPRSPRRARLRLGVTAVASGILAAGALAVMTSGGASAHSNTSLTSHTSHTSHTMHSNGPTSGPMNGPTSAPMNGPTSGPMNGPASGTGGHTSYSFTTLDDRNDPTFNQLLGINEQGLIAGYFGSGGAGHPNQGYQLQPPYGQANYAAENYPGSVQTQVTGLNNQGVTVGFFSGQNNQNLMNDNFGFYDDGQFHEVNFPTHNNATPPVNQLLGISDHGVAVGFYTNAQGNNRGYTYDTRTGKFTRVLVPGAPHGVAGPSLTAAAINNSGDIAGFYTTAAGRTDGFVTDGHHFTGLAFPGAAATTALGINDGTEVVGSYTVGTGSAAVMHGFTWTPSRGFSTVDDPSGIGATTINGINRRGDLVGFYTDTAGNTDGFLATRAGRMVRHLALKPMPAGTASFGRDGSGQLTVQLATFGMTPGSSHTVELLGPAGSAPLTQFAALTASPAGQGNMTLGSSYLASIPAGSRLVILNGSQGGSVANEPIAETSQLTGNVSGQVFTLNAVEVSPAGTSYGTPGGQGTITYDPGAHTLTVTVQASGLTPGNHAAHIHLGSCASQGGVQYMMMDLVANSQGKIVDETRVISGVTAPIPASGWYLNIHQGDSATILQNGQPTIDFRPLLCSGI